MKLDVTVRAELARRIMDSLEEVPDSKVWLRGSLGTGHVDQYSDIDITWVIPDETWDSSIVGLPAILDRMHPVESVRSDPDFQRSAKHRLIFVRLAGVPLFWRLDLEIFAQSIGEDPAYDRDNPGARGGDWSPTESALANAVAAVKAHLRDDDVEAQQLLLRAYRRVGLTSPALDEREAILRLAEDVTAMDPATAALGSRIKELVEETWQQPGGRL